MTNGYNVESIGVKKKYSHNKKKIYINEFAK